MPAPTTTQETLGNRQTQAQKGEMLNRSKHCLSYTIKSKGEDRALHRFFAFSECWFELLTGWADTLPGAGFVDFARCRL